MSVTPPFAKPEAPHRFTQIVDASMAAAIAAAAAVFSFWSSIQGISTTPDSAQYLSAAESLARGDGFRIWNGAELTSFPPGYPLIIRVGMLLGVTAETSARMIGVVAVAAVVFATGHLASIVTGRRINSLVSLVTALVPYVLYISTWIYAESIFAACILLAAIALTKVVQSGGRSTPWMVVMVIGTWMSCALRYAGYAVIAACCLALLWMPAPLKRRLRSATSYGVWAIVAPVVIVGHNVWRSDGPGRPRIGPRDDFWSNVVDSVRAIGRWTGPRPSWLSTVGDGSLGMVILILGSLIVALAISSMRSRIESRVIMALITVAGVFLVFIWMSARLVWVSVDQRVLYPMLPILLSIVASAIVLLLSGRSRSWIGAMIVAYVVTTVLLRPQLLQAVRFAHEYPQGYGRPEWTQSKIVDTIRALPTEQVVYSNHPEGVWIHTRRTGINRINSLARQQEESEREYVERLNRSACTEPFLAWIDHDGETAPLDEIVSYARFIEYPTDEGRAGILIPIDASICAER